MTGMLKGGCGERNDIDSGGHMPTVSSRPSHDMHISRYSSGEKHRQVHCHLSDKIRVSTSVACVYRGRVPTVRSADHDLTESNCVESIVPTFEQRRLGFQRASKSAGLNKHSSFNK